MTHHGVCSRSFACGLLCINDYNFKYINYLAESRVLTDVQRIIYLFIFKFNLPDLISMETWKGHKEIKKNFFARSLPVFPLGQCTSRSIRQTCNELAICLLSLSILFRFLTLMWKPRLRPSTYSWGQIQNIMRWKLCKISYSFSLRSVYFSLGQFRTWKQNRSGG